LHSTILFTKYLRKEGEKEKGGNSTQYYSLQWEKKKRKKKREEKRRGLIPYYLSYTNSRKGGKGGKKEGI